MYAATMDTIYGLFALHTGTSALAFGAFDLGASEGLLTLAIFLACLAFCGFGLACLRERLIYWFAGGLILLYAIGAHFFAIPALLPLKVSLLLEIFSSAIVLGVRLNRVSLERIILEEKWQQMQWEMERAESIHRTLLPAQLPDRPDFSVHVLYRPMSRLGGDLYDTEQTGPQRYLVLLADVSGHGLPAALDSALVRAAFARARRDSQRPGRILTEMSLFLSPHLAYRFVSAICVLADLDAREIVLSRAGHPYPIFITKNEATVIRPGGPLLGMRDMLDFEESVLSWDDGARLLLYTDGLSERNLQQKIPLLEFCQKNRFVAAEEFGGQLIAAQGDMQAIEDDVTVVCLSFGSWARPKK